MTLDEIRNLLEKTTGRMNDMTLDEVRNLTDDELRIKVAELCGWIRIQREEDSKDVDIDDVGCGFVGLPPHMKEGVEAWEKEGHSPTINWPIPDYPHDLNAMHEVCLKIIRDGLFAKWFTNLQLIVSMDCGSCVDGYMINAAARQRAEAFVLTMGGAENDTIAPLPHH